MNKIHDRNRPPTIGRKDYPMRGERLGPAWRAAWVRLCDQEDRRTKSVAGADLVELMIGAAEIQDDTARILLAQMRRAGVLVVEHRMTRTRFGDRPLRRMAWYRIAPAYRPALQP